MWQNQTALGPNQVKNLLVVVEKALISLPQTVLLKERLALVEQFVANLITLSSG